MRYQFQVDNRAAGPVRATWHEAAEDAIAAGYASRAFHGVAFDSQASIRSLASPAPKGET